MASRYWIKLYHEILDDPKMGRLSDALYRRVIELFLIAGDYDKEGLLPSVSDIAWRLRIPEDILVSQFAELRDFGILSIDDQGCWFVTHFSDRQSADSISQRVRRHRVSLHKKEYYGYGKRNENVTKRYTDVDIDKEVDKEKKENSDEEEEKSSFICSPDEELVKTFIEHTRIPFNSGGSEKWSSALHRLKNAGVEKIDLITAIGECYHKGITIASLSSIVNPAIISMSRRRSGKAPPDPDDYERYTRGEYGHIGVH
jgi:hypothetical protein